MSYLGSYLGSISYQEIELYSILRLPIADSNCNRENISLHTWFPAGVFP